MPVNLFVEFLDSASPTPDPYKKRIAELYAERERQPRKQRYTTQTMFNIPEPEGCRGTRSTLGHYPAELRKEKRRPKVFLPLEFELAEDAQVDWAKRWW